MLRLMTWLLMALGVKKGEGERVTEREKYENHIVVGILSLNDFVNFQQNVRAVWVPFNCTVILQSYMVNLHTN